MIIKRHAAERGLTKIDWLTSHHSFSFSDYRDPQFMGFGPLRVINEDFVTPGEGFHTHSHADMEIITYVLSGALAHRDSLGNGTVINTGEVQKMSAGTGIEHSEFNASKTDPVHFVQIWIRPNARGVTPSYGQITPANNNRLQLVVSPNGGNNIIPIHQDAELHIGKLKSGEQLSVTTDRNRLYWAQWLDGVGAIDGESMAKGDGAAIQDVSGVTINSKEPSQFLWFSLPK